MRAHLGPRQAVLPGRWMTGPPFWLVRDSFAGPRPPGERWEVDRAAPETDHNELVVVVVVVALMAVAQTRQLRYPAACLRELSALSYYRIILAEAKSITFHISYL